MTSLCSLYTYKCLKYNILQDNLRELRTKPCPSRLSSCARAPHDGGTGRFPGIDRVQNASHVTQRVGRASSSGKPMNRMQPESERGRVPRRSFLLSALFLCPGARLLRAAQDATFSTDVKVV